MAKQKLGQHFLKDPVKAEKIVNSLLHLPGPVLEIGPGVGALTDIMDRKAEGRTVISVEKDAALIPALESMEYRNIRIVQADILKTDPTEFFGTTPANLLGNIPYLISKEIIDWIIKHSESFSAGTLMVQKEFFLKITSPPGSKLYNAQSVMFGTLFETAKLFDVPPGSFSPPPKVTSTVFTFTHREQTSLNSKFKILNSEFYIFLKSAFRNRRKTLLNNLKKEYDQNTISKFLESESLPGEIRSEDLSRENFAKLFNNLEYKI